MTVDITSATFIIGYISGVICMIAFPKVVTHLTVTKLKRLFGNSTSTSSTSSNTKDGECQNVKSLYNIMKPKLLGTV